MAKKEPMIKQENRPSAIDYDAPISDWLVRDLMAVLDARCEIFKPPEKEILKPPEKEILKPPEKEFFKPPEKEFLKPEKEYTKPEKEFRVPDLVDKVATRVVEILKEQGLFG